MNQGQPLIPITFPVAALARIRAGEPTCIV